MEPRFSERDEFFDAIEQEDDLDVLRIPSVTRKSTFFTEPLHRSVEMDESSSSSEDLVEIGFSSVNLNKFASADFSTAASANLKHVKESQVVITVPEWSSRVQKNNKEVLEYQNLKLVQEVPLSKEIGSYHWVMKFSPDGRFLAIGGQRGSVSIFEVARERVPNGEQYLLHPFAYKELPAGLGGISAIDWNNVGTHILTASDEGQVYLWQLDSDRPIASFAHTTSVTASLFHPKNNNIFVTGSIDGQIRVFDISEVKIIGQLEADDGITAVAYSPSGELLAAGLSKGQVILYGRRRSEGDYIQLTNINCRNRRGRMSNGRRVTGISFMDENNFLVTTNDSNIRLYDVKGLKQLQKYKGLKNERSCVKAYFSHDFKHVISGSETGEVFIWNTFTYHIPRFNPKILRRSTDKNKSYEKFSVRGDKVTCYASCAGERTVSIVNERYEAVGKRGTAGIILSIDCRAKLRVFYNMI